MSDNQEIMVSVLMLTYNHEPYVAQALDSILGQETDFRYEIVISDDASRDATKRILLGYKDRNKELITLLLTSQNQGLIGNFLKAYEACRGKYIAICEGDDFWISRNKLQRQVSYLESHPQCAICFHRAVNLYEDSGAKSLSNPHQEEDTGILDLAKSNYLTNVTTVFRRAAFGALPPWFSQVSTYDYALHMLTAQTGSIHYMKEPMAVYRQRQTAIWSQAGQDRKWEISLKVRELLMDHFMETDPEVYQNLRTSYGRIALNYMDFARQQMDGAKKAEDIRKRMMERFKGEDFQQVCQILEKGIRKPGWWESLFRKVLSTARAFISKQIPLPRITPKK